MTLTGTEDAQQRAKSLIEELLIDKSCMQENVESVRNIASEPEQKQEIDWTNFDWGKANEEYVCFAS